MLVTSGHSTYYLTVMVVSSIELHFTIQICLVLDTRRGPGSSVGIATDYELDGPRSNPGGDEVIRPSIRALGSTQPPVQWVPGLSRV